MIQPSPQRTNSSWLPNSTVLSPTDSSLTLSYITRHVVGRQKWQQNQEVRVGFLWAWNSMLSKRWRNPSGPVCDESNGSKLLSDFRKFCANDDDRLKNYWIQALDQVSSSSSWIYSSFLFYYKKIKGLSIVSFIKFVLQLSLFSEYTNWFYLFRLHFKKA